MVEDRPWSFTAPDPIRCKSVIVKSLFDKLFLTQTFKLSVLLRDDGVVVPMFLEARVPQTALSDYITIFIRQCFVRNDCAEMRRLLHRCPVASHAVVADSAHGNIAV